MKFVSAFDKRVSTARQMDVHIIYFYETTNRVKRVYLNSQFMGHATVSGMKDYFKKVHNGLDIINKVIINNRCQWMGQM